LERWNNKVRGNLTAEEQKEEKNTKTRKKPEKRRKKKIFVKDIYSWSFLEIFFRRRP
jgi:hypothetical protein